MLFPPLGTQAGTPTGTQLDTFSPDGAAVTSSGSGQTTAHGAWVANGDRSFSVTTVRLYFNDKGDVTSSLKLRAAIQLDETGNTATGQYQYDIFDPAGAVQQSGAGTALGTRISVEPLR